MDDLIAFAEQRMQQGQEDLAKAQQAKAAQKAAQGNGQGGGNGTKGSSGANNNNGAQGASDQFQTGSQQQLQDRERERIAGMSGRALPQPIQNMSQLSPDSGQQDPASRQVNETRQRVHTNEGIYELNQRQLARQATGVTDSALT